MTFQLGQRVKLVDVDKTPNVSGYIIGTYTEVKNVSLRESRMYDPEMYMGYLVKLDEGFYDPAHNIFVRCLPVHPDNLIALEG